MTKEKMVSLKKYMSDLTNRLESPVIPEKHKGHPEHFKAFLRNEIRMVKQKLDDHALATGPEAKK